MLIHHRFELPIDLAAARRIQERLRRRVILDDEFLDIREIKTVAGCDVAYDRYGKRVFAAVVVMEAGSFTVVEKVTFSGRASFPYIPGFLSFREGPVLLAAIKRLKTEPDVFLFDGQGIAHPRRMGIACHLGVILDKPSIGCAKTHLYGSYDEPAGGRGASSFIQDERGRRLGLVLRTRTGVKPVFVSPGHRCGVKMAGEVVMFWARKYRLPEPLRLAHILAQSAVNHL